MVSAITQTSTTKRSRIASTTQKTSNYTPSPAAKRTPDYDYDIANTLGKNQPFFNEDPNPVRLFSDKEPADNSSMIEDLEARTADDPKVPDIVF